MTAPQPQPVRTYLSSQDACDALVLANGDMSLAAEALGTTTGQMMAALAQDQANVAYLNNMVRTMLLMDMMNTIKVGTEVIRTKYEDMPPEAALKGIAALAAVAERLSDNHVSTLNANATLTARGSFEHIMREFPPQVRQAMLVLSNSNDPSSLDILSNMLASATGTQAQAQAQADANDQQGNTPRVIVPYEPRAHHNGHGDAQP